MRLSSPSPLVVRASSGRPPGPSIADAAATMRSSPGRSRGSPPVNRTRSTPSRSTATRTTRTTSSSVSVSSTGSQASPSAGMQ